MPRWAEAQPPPIQPAGVNVELEKATAAEAIQALAELWEVDFVTGPLPQEAKPFALEEASPVEALAVLCQTYEIEATLWRGLLVAVRQDKPLLLGQRLQAALAPGEAALLFRPRDEDDRPAPGFERVIEAMKVLAQGKDDPAAHEVLRQAALWMAAGELPYLLRPIEAVQSGQALLKIEPRTTWVRWVPQPDEDPCTDHLLLVPPAEGPADEVLRPLSFHAQGFDRFARQLQQERGLISLEEYKQRLVKATRERDDPFYQRGALTNPVTLGETAGNAAEIVRSIAEELGVKIAVEGAASPPIVLNVANAAGADVLRAVAYCAGLTLLEDREKGGYLLTPPICPLEQIQSAFPLPLWAAANSTAVERDLLRQQWVDFFFQCCRPEELQMLASRPVRVADLTPLQQTILLELVYGEAGGRFQKWLQNLPERHQLPPLWLYESTEKGIYELAAPGVSEQVRGWLYLRLKTQLAGQPGLTSPLWKLLQTDTR